MMESEITTITGCSPLNLSHFTCSERLSVFSFVYKIDSQEEEE